MEQGCGAASPRAGLADVDSGGVLGRPLHLPVTFEIPLRQLWMKAGDEGAAFLGTINHLLANQERSQEMRGEELVSNRN